MTAKQRPGPLTISNHIYRVLLRIYPASFRNAYGEEMAQLFRDVSTNEFSRHGSSGLFRLWLHTLSDWLKTVCEQHIQEVFQMTARDWMIRIGAIAAMVGGLLGIYYLFQAPNAYGNYDWNGTLAFAVPLLFVLGIGGGMALYGSQLDALGRAGLFIIMAGFITQAMGYLVDSLWAFIFLGPIIVAPVGAILLARTNLQRESLPAWWRTFPFLLLAISFAGFGIEIYEEWIGVSTPDRGLQLAEALFSLAWIGLGVGLWARANDRADDTPLVA